MRSPRAREARRPLLKTQHTVLKRSLPQDDTRPRERVRLRVCSSLQPNRVILRKAPPRERLKRAVAGFADEESLSETGGLLHQTRP
jgi:hypothetical protein